MAEEHVARVTTVALADHITLRPHFARGMRDGHALAWRLRGLPIAKRDPSTARLKKPVDLADMSSDTQSSDPLLAKMKNE